MDESTSIKLKTAGNLIMIVGSISAILTGAISGTRGGSTGDSAFLFATTTIGTGLAVTGVGSLYGASPRAITDGSGRIILGTGLVAIPLTLSIAPEQTTLVLLESAYAVCGAVLLGTAQDLGNIVKW
jgi:hypothetical protein